MLKNKSIELLDDTSGKKYQSLNLYDDNIENNLSAVSKDNDEHLEILIDISDLFKDVTVYNSFTKLTEIFAGIKDKEELSVIDNLEFINKDLMDINTEGINNLLSCA